MAVARRFCGGPISCCHENGPDGYGATGNGESWVWRSCLRFLRGWESRVVPFDVMRLLRWRREKLLYQAAFVGLEGLELLGFGGDQGVEAAEAHGDVVTLVDELGFGADEADELLACPLRLARSLSRVAGNEAHDVVVIDDGGGKEDELEVDLVHGVL